jgi:hypothetical protein
LGFEANFVEEPECHFDSGGSRFHFDLALDEDMLAEMDIDRSSVQVGHFEGHLLDNLGSRSACMIAQWASAYIDHHLSAGTDAEKGEEHVAGS